MSFAVPVASFFVGVDWAAESHAVCVMDQEGKVLSRFTIDHFAEGIATPVRWLARYGEAEDVPIAIEPPNGRLVVLLLEAGHPVVPVGPDAIATWPEGEILSGAKSGAADAWAAHIDSQARTAGKDHPHAVRILARAGIRVVGHCWYDGVPCGPPHTMPPQN